MRLLAALLLAAAGLRAGNLDELFLDGQLNGDPYHAEQGAEFDLRFKNYVAGPAFGLQAAPWLRLGLGAFGEYIRSSNVNRYWSSLYKPGTEISPFNYSYAIHSRTDTRIAV